MSARDRVRRRLRTAVGLEADPVRFVDRHDLSRLLGTPVEELERPGRCSCGAGVLGAVRCLLDGTGAPALCPWCRVFCRPPMLEA